MLNTQRKIIRPDTAEGVRDAVQAALADAAPLAVEGTGSKAAIGKPVQAAATLSTAGLSGITLYEPEELVLSARAGTPMAEIEDALQARGQRLEFEPIDYGPLLDNRRARARWAAPCRATFRARAGSSRAPRATIYWGLPPFPAGAKSTAPAAAW